VTVNGSRQPGCQRWGCGHDLPARPSAGHQSVTSTTSAIFRDLNKALNPTCFYIPHINLTPMTHHTCPSPKCSFSSTRIAELSKHKLTCSKYKAWHKKGVEKGFWRLMAFSLKRQRLQDPAVQVSNAPSKMVTYVCYWCTANVLCRYRRLLILRIWMRVPST